MKRLRNVGLLSLVLTCAAIVPSMAQFTFTFDEDGHGVFNGNTLTGTLQPDPSNGGAPALTYFLPDGFHPVGNGTVNVLEPTGEVVSDALRFTDANGSIVGTTADRMLFYSDNSDGGENLADTGFPRNLNEGAHAGPVREDATGAFAFDAGVNHYRGQSDGEAQVPEPGVLVMLSGFGVAGTLIIRRRRR